MAATGPPQQPTNTAQKLAHVNERTWLTMGNLAEMMTDYEKAMNCYESALRHNPYSIKALTQIATLCRGREQFARAVEYFKRILAIQENNGETWAALGHCYLMMDNLQEAYHAYQQALYHLSNPKDPKLWYGIGILYDRYGSLEHAEEAFSAVMKMDPKFEKANEIYFRLGIIYKQQQKFDLSLQCFRYILQSPPRPLTESDIWFQTGHVYEQQKEYEQAKEAYERVLAENPDHAKVLQQLGWLYHQQNTSFCNQSLAIQYLTRSLKSDSNDAQSWYLLGRCYMAEQNYNKAYEAYQQAVYRDARNPTFWCSIGVLYYQINQYRDALDAYSRAIRLNPYISEVWYNLGTLYESCNNQIQDALDAYQRAAELDPSNLHIKQRLELLRKSQSHTPQTPGSVPTPRDVSNPSQYQNGSNAQPLNGSSYAQNSAPSGPPNGMDAYHTQASSQQRPVEERGPAPHLPMALPPHETNSGPGRDLPMPSGPPPQQSPATSGRRSPGPYPPSSYPPSTTREDVRIPDIGNGEGRAPTPSERTQMNPIMQDNGRSHTQHSPMSGPPPPHHLHGSQSGLPTMHQSPYGKSSSSEGIRSPNVSNDNNGRPHALTSPQLRPTSNLQHGSSPKQYESIPQQQQQIHHRSPGISHAEQQQQQQQQQQPYSSHHYEMSSHHPEYDHSPRHTHAPNRPPAADNHYPPRQEPLPHSPSPTTYPRPNQPTDSYHRGGASVITPNEDSSALPPPRQHHPHGDIKQQEHERTLRSPHHDTSRETSHYQHTSKKETESYKSGSIPTSRASGNRTTDDDYDASAADMLLSIGQSRGDKRAYPPDDSQAVEEPKRMRPNQDGQDTDHHMTNATSAVSSPSKETTTSQQQYTPSTTEDVTGIKPSVSGHSTSPPSSSGRQPSSPPPTASSPAGSPQKSPSLHTPKSEPNYVSPPKSTAPVEASSDPSKEVTSSSLSDEGGPAESTTTTSTPPPSNSEATDKKADVQTEQRTTMNAYESNKMDEDEDEEEEGELRDDADQQVGNKNDVDMKEASPVKEDEKEEGEVTSGTQEGNDKQVQQQSSSESSTVA